MTSNKGTKKKAKAQKETKNSAKRPSNSRRKKNAKEIKKDNDKMLHSLWKLYFASNKWAEEAQDCEFIYKRMASEYNDNLREAVHKAYWANQTMGKEYVADNLQSHWDTTSYEGLYKSEAA